MDSFLAVVGGLSAQSSWWTFSTGAAILADLLPKTLPAFYIGLVFGLVGLCFALSPLVVQAAGVTRLFQSAKVATIVQAGFLVIITTVIYSKLLFSETPLDTESYNHQVMALAVICLLFATASAASFKVQESLNGIASLPSIQLVDKVWLGGTVCATVMGLAQLALHHLIQDARARGIGFFSLGCIVCAAGWPAIDALQRRHKDSTSADETSLILNEEHDPGHAGLNNKEAVRAVLSHMPIPYLVSAVDFAYMMSLYPGLLSVLHGRQEAGSEFTVTLFCAFNVGDCLGKFLPSIFPWLAAKSRRLLAALILEVCFFSTLIILSILLPDLQHDAIAFAIAFAMAATHGYVSVSSYNHVSLNIRNLPRQSLSTLAGQLNFVSSFFGVGIGVLISIALSESPLVKQ
eukprot:m.308602 g.308602  ORF g.308602 m.308602 type:complete len:404 (+) comp21540_c0_seq1:60-1271(+)